jgi:hypothetical protein
MQDLVDTVRDPAASDEASASSAQDRLQELLQRIRRDLAAPEMSSARAAGCNRSVGIGRSPPCFAAAR